MIGLTYKHIEILERLSRAPIGCRAQSWNVVYPNEIGELDDIDYIEQYYNRLANRSEWHITAAGRNAYDNHVLSQTDEDNLPKPQRTRADRVQPGFKISREEFSLDNEGDTNVP